ncbi:MAG TPA: trimethylamine methyltransferase family protein [Thermoleophilia bacterium]|nr:trimethylamine methyltransferase family protein [Thermoleophilia bacterium]
MRAHMTWLTDDEKRLIVEEALGILENVGFRAAGSRVLPLLADAGATVDFESGAMRLPADLVREALGRCPRSFVMAGASSEYDVVLGEGRPFRFTPSGCGARTIDYVTGERRPSTLEDVRLATALNDSLPELSVMWTMVSATDVPPERRELLEYYTILRETDRHVTFVDCPSQVDSVKRIFEVLAGDLERFRARPRVTTLVTAASPLQVDGPVLDVHVAMAECGAPVKVYSMTSAGATSPMTIAGTVTQGVAEFLAIATMLQIAVPGTRVIFCCGSGVLDMRHTTFSIGCLENAMVSVAATEVGHYMGVPTMNPAMSTDARYPGIQAGYEKALKALTVCSANPDLVSGWGLLDSSSMLYLPQIVIDNEIAQMVRRLLSEVDVSEASIMPDAFARVGIGGDFLREKDTARRTRAGEYFMPQVANRLPYEVWQKAGKTEDDAARAVIERVMTARADRRPGLADDQLAELAAICGIEGTA